MMSQRDRVSDRGRETVGTGSREPETVRCNGRVGSGVEVWRLAHGRG